ncbi:hypothetical protein [Variovorax sp. Root473]|jgi:hypothetical protein|uniref:hypothetical protein n=1 Tax=Variovorax sp. Root473 TaxID=1736541 RepID=UPI0006F83642|nr:hypothetical protein [Variovorax sp. Root473]KQX84974.1 hypothetical protein ASD34_19130 [Variovorax sp. Root473]
MSTRKGWRDRLAGHPNLPNVKVNPPAMRGLQVQMSRLTAEGHTVVQGGRRYFVEDFARKLVGTR